MLKDVVEVRPLQGHCLYIRFEDGAEGEVDLDDFVQFDGVFAPLRQPDNFRAVEVHPEFGTVVWSRGADLDPDVLHARVMGQSRAPFLRCYL